MYANYGSCSNASPFGMRQTALGLHDSHSFKQGLHRSSVGKNVSNMFKTRSYNILLFIQVLVFNSLLASFLLNMLDYTVSILSAYFTVSKGKARNRHANTHANTHTRLSI